MALIHERIKELSSKEKANTKGREISRLIKSVPRTNVKFSNADYDIEIISTTPINGGIEVLARAWKDGEQVGFGKDGSIDIERFNIYNPPILVDDPNGDIIREYRDFSVATVEGVIRQRTLKEDPLEAILESIAHTISVKKQKFGSGKIIKDKVGNTTSTFYPAAGANSPVDGRVGREGVDEAWSTIRGGAGTDAFSAESGAGAWLQILGSTTSNQFARVRRNIFGFDTSSLSTDTIDSATFSLYSSNGAAVDNLSVSGVKIDRRVPADTAALATGDYAVAGWANVAQSDTEITVANFMNGVAGYKDWALNATGLGNVNGSGLSWYGARFGNDLDNSAPSWGSNQASQITFYFADETGTTSDPKLVVEHSEATSPSSSISSSPSSSISSSPSSSPSSSISSSPSSSISSSPSSSISDSPSSSISSSPSSSESSSLSPSPSTSISSSPSSSVSPSSSISDSISSSISDSPSSSVSSSISSSISSSPSSSVSPSTSISSSVSSSPSPSAPYGIILGRNTDTGIIQGVRLRKK